MSRIDGKTRYVVESAYSYLKYNMDYITSPEIRAHVEKAKSELNEALKLIGPEKENKEEAA